MHGNPVAHPGAADAREEEEAGEKNERSHRKRDGKRAARPISVLRHDLRRPGIRGRLAGNRDDVISLGIHMTNNRQLNSAVVFDKVDGPVLRNRHSAFDGEKSGRQLPEHHEDDTGVDD